jgi:hypothetical protein
LKTVKLAAAWPLLRVALLVAITAGCLVTGFALRPTQSTPPQISDIGVNVFADRAGARIDHLILTVQRRLGPNHTPEGWLLLVSGWLSAPVGTAPPKSETQATYVDMTYVVMGLPELVPGVPGSWTVLPGSGPPCEAKHSCGPASDAHSLHDYVETAQFPGKSDGSVSSWMSFGIEVKPSIAIASNGAYVVVQTPDLNLHVDPPDIPQNIRDQLHSLPVSESDLPPGMSGSYYVPEVSDIRLEVDSFELAALQLTTITSIPSDPLRTRDGSGWYWTDASRATLTARDVAAQDHRDTQLFVAGLFFGIAGSAAIALVQELPRGKRSSETSLPRGGDFSRQSNR